MSKTKDLVEKALNDVKQNQLEEEKLVSVSIPVRSRRSLHGLHFMYREPSCVYVPSCTDQTHALSISQQVRRGQGDSESPQKDAYDFPDGKDDGSAAHGVFEFAERADAWMAEQNLGDELKASFRKQVLQRTADLAMKEQALKSSQTLENGSKIAQDSKVDDKTSTLSK